MDGGEGGAFQAVNPVIVDVSYLQWLCLQFPIYINSRGSQAACGAVSSRWERAGSPAVRNGAEAGVPALARAEED